MPKGEVSRAPISSTTARASTSTAPPTRETRALTMAATAFVTPTAAFLERPAAVLAACFARCARLFCAAAWALRRARSTIRFAVGFPASWSVAFPAAVPFRVACSTLWRVLGVKAPPGGFSLGAV